MKNYLLITLMFVAFLTNAQTPFTLISLHETSKGVSAQRVASANNPYVGAKLAYNVKGDVSNSIILSGTAMLVPVSGENYAIPVVTNVSLNNTDSLQDDSGFSLGLFPFYRLVSDGNLRLNLHAGISYQILDLKATDNQTQLRMLLGFEVALYGDNEGSPITLSVAPEYVRNTTSMTNTFGLGMTGVLPIANGLGALIQGLVPFDDSQSTGVEIGIIVNSSIRN